MNVRLVYFDQNDIATLMKKKVKDGKVDIEDKSFLVDLSRAKFLKTTFGYSPLFFVKHDSVYPDNKLNPIYPEFALKGDKVNPEILRKTMSLKILGNMLKVKKEIGWFKPTAIGLAFGAFVMYYLIAMKIVLI